MKIAFLSVYLGLITGINPVELSIVGDVDRVAILLDGEVVQVLHSEPWGAQVDFGAAPQPHELVAIALGPSGQELDRAQQWINLAPSRSQAKIRFHRNDQGAPRAVQLSWERLGHAEPESVEVSFDGQSLPVDNLESIPLPPHDLSSLHYITATVRFADGETSRLDTTFGGPYWDDLEGELTSVALELEDGARLPPREQLEGWFVKGDQGLQISSIEQTPAEVVAVVAPEAREYLERILLGTTPPGDRGWRDGQMRERARLQIEGTLTVVSPTAAPADHTGPSHRLFPQPSSHSLTEASFVELLYRNPSKRHPTRLADAVAVAGLRAHASQARRAVVLVLGEDDEDQSSFSPREVRSYLRQLQVPLLVWSTTSAAAAPGWGRVQYVGHPLRFSEAMARVNQAAQELVHILNRQRIVWLRGGHLPQDVRLSRHATGVQLAGSSASRLATANGGEDPTSEDLDTVGGGSAPDRELAAPASEGRRHELDATSPTGQPELALLSDPQGRPAALRFRWQGSGTVDPGDIEVSFDGEALPADDLERIPLPPYDIAEVHVISVMRRFPTGHIYRLNASFGGPLGNRFSDELTPVVIELEDGKILPATEELGGWFGSDEGGLRVMRVEQGPLEVVLVRDPKAQAAISKMVGSGPSNARRREWLQGWTWLETPGHLILLSPLAAPESQIELSYELFPQSPSYSLNDGGVPWLISRAGPVEHSTRLADAVAMAGLMVHASQRKRAVVLLLGEVPEDQSRLSPEESRELLRRLQVPLFVWSTACDSPVPAWGEVLCVSHPRRASRAMLRLDEAVNRLAQALERQRVVWLEGRHRPEDITLTEEATGVRLAGTPETLLTLQH